MRFVPAVPTNATDGGGNNWWRITVTQALPAISVADTTIDELGATVVRKDTWEKIPPAWREEMVESARSAGQQRPVPQQRRRSIAS